MAGNEEGRAHGGRWSTRPCAPWRRLRRGACMGVVFAASESGAQPCIPMTTQPLPPLVGFHITGMVGFDDGGGWALYVAGLSSTASSVLRWDGEAWRDISLNDANIYQLQVFDAGNGPALYGGGSAWAPGGASRIGVLARWVGENWTRVDDGINGGIGVLAVFDDGTGPALYMGGHFTQAGGVPASRIARWDGETFSALGTGLDLNPTLAGMAPFYEDPAGPALYVGGPFTTAGGLLVNHIARWNGQQWSAVGAGTNGTVYPLAVFEELNGAALFASGEFSEPAPWFARWDGNTWAGLGQPMNHQAFSLAAFDAGDGPFLYAAGAFTSVWPRYAARWDGSQWSGFLDFVPPHIGTRLAPAHDGAPALYIAFQSLNTTSFARWGCPVEPAPCYSNCDNSTIAPILNVDDFTCFINEFAGAQMLPHSQQIEHYANCDASTTAPVLNVDDFTCFINAFAAGCP